MDIYGADIDSMFDDGADDELNENIREDDERDENGADNDDDDDEKKTDSKPIPVEHKTRIVRRPQVFYYHSSQDRQWTNVY